MENKKDFSKIDYRFSFVLSVDDITTDNPEMIICKRDFNINNLDETALKSLELKECVDDIVNLIDCDIKSKSRVYTWHNIQLENRGNQVIHGSELDVNAIQEFKTPIPEQMSVMFKFSLYDNGRLIISKGWSGDEYPAQIRNSVDLTNKKYKTDSNQYLDFIKSICQRSSADKTDLTISIIRHISSVCSSYSSEEYGKRIIYKQILNDIATCNKVFGDGGKGSSTNYRVKPICVSRDENRGIDKIVYRAYTTNLKYSGKLYSTDNEEAPIQLKLTKK